MNEMPLVAFAAGGTQTNNHWTRVNDYQTVYAGILERLQALLTLETFSITSTRQTSLKL